MKGICHFGLRAAFLHPAIDSAGKSTAKTTCKWTRMRADSPLSEALYEDARYIQGDHCRETLDIEVEQEQRSVRPFIVQDGAETVAGGSVRGIFTFF